MVVEFRLHSALNVMPDDPGEKLAYKAVMISLLMKSVTSKLEAAVYMVNILRKLTYLARV